MDAVLVPQAVKDHLESAAYAAMEEGTDFAEFILSAARLFLEVTGEIQ